MFLEKKNKQEKEEAEQILIDQAQINVCESYARNFGKLNEDLDVYTLLKKPVCKKSALRCQKFF